MKFSGAGLEDGVDVAAAVSSLAGVVKRSLNLKLLDDVGVRQRHVRGLRHVVVRRADPFDQEIVVVLALAIDEKLHAAASQLRRRIEFALRAAGKRQQLLIILRRQRQFPYGFRAQRLPGRRAGRFDARNLRGYFHFLAHRAGLQRNRDFRGFRHAHFDAGGLRLREARLIHHHDVDSRRQQRSNEGSIRVRCNFARQRFRAGIDDLYFGVPNRAPARIHNDAADGSRRASLSVSARTHQYSRQHQHGGYKSNHVSHKHPQRIGLHAPRS